MKKEIKYKGTDTDFGSPYYQPTISRATKCGHQIDFEQVAGFGRDECKICREWVHREELIKNRTNQIKALLKEIELLTNS